MCATSIWASCGWSLLTDRAAHSDEHSRSQPQEQMTSQRSLTGGVTFHCLSQREDVEILPERDHEPGTRAPDCPCPRGHAQATELLPRANCGRESSGQFRPSQTPESPRCWDERFLVLEPRAVRLRCQSDAGFPAQ